MAVSRSKARSFTLMHSFHNILSIEQISGRKSSRCVTLKGNTAEQGVVNIFTTSLIDIESCGESIKPIVKNVNSREGLFERKELEKDQ